MAALFSGLKIIDLTRVFSGPFATRLFADYGAEVIKIEHDAAPDDARAYPPLINGWSGYYELLNRNKSLLRLNLKDANDLAAFYDLCTNADVIVENLTPPTKYKLKIDYSTLQAINPRLIYASLSGRGQHDDRGYYDVLAQAESGLLSLSGIEDQPMKIGPSVVDAFSGSMLAFGIAAALYYREHTGLGQYLDLNMLACSMNLLESNLTETSITGTNPLRTGNHDNLIAPFGVYQAQDGRIALAVGNDRQWLALSQFLNAHVSVDAALFATNGQRLNQQQQLTVLIERVFCQYSRQELESLLEARQIPCAAVNEMTDVAALTTLYESGALVKLNHPQVGEYVVAGRCISFSEGDLPLFQPAPQLDQAHDGIS